MDIAEFFSDYDQVQVDATTVKLETLQGGAASQQKQNHNEENRSSTGTSVLDQEQSPLDDANLCSTSPVCAAPLCRQFWKAGTYNDDVTPKSTIKSGSSYLHIHPKFLHSNATSHKWAFGAIAELIDNAVDEIQNDATYVIIDKTINPRNGCTALVIQDDGSGMDPEAMRHCLSFGFSDKKSQFAIGKYGNGFKTSTMRLGADVIVFSRYLTDRSLTQSIGLLSYTFLTQAGYDRIVVPMVHYGFDFTTGTFVPLYAQSSENPNSNLSVILKWSPYSTEEELLKQFDDVGSHGTKIIIYNLWLDDDGNMELDFESDPEDIRITWDGKGNAKEGTRMAATDQHIANRLCYSLRTYLSVLYKKLPETFAMVLRAKVVLYHNIATDLKHPEFIMYKPHSDGRGEGSVVTTIGFDNDAPNVNVHGFNIYHKNRLILPFQQVVVIGGSRGRGVIGVLEANFIEPTHNKQDFEKTSLFQKLMTRLKEMTLEYWDYHCGLIGYQQGHNKNKKARTPSVTGGSSNSIHQQVKDQSTFKKGSSDDGTTKGAPFITTVNSKAALYSNSSFFKPVELKQSFPQGFKEGSNLKRKLSDESQSFQPEAKMGTTVTDLGNTGGSTNVMDENKRLKTRCLEFEKAEEELKHKVSYTHYGGVCFLLKTSSYLFCLRRADAGRPLRSEERLFSGRHFVEKELPTLFLVQTLTSIFLPLLLSLISSSPLLSPLFLITSSNPSNLTQEETLFSSLLPPPHRRRRLLPPYRRRPLRLLPLPYRRDPCHLPLSYCRRRLPPLLPPPPHPFSSLFTAADPPPPPSLQPPHPFSSGDIKTADLWSTSSPADVSRCGPQTADIFLQKKQTAPKS